ncbi:MAG: polyprenol monophosphomannose synthase [Anaerolineales bacterium]|nr:polyprenol monophosphomannose synthase [Anaerolineales bacterium]
MVKTFIVVPTYNEKDNLPILVEALFELDIEDLHILIVDDNSPDGTGKIADEIKEKTPARVSVLHRKGKLGLGTAYLSGFKYCLEQGADQIVQMDADFSHNPNKVTELIERLKVSDMALGSRYIRGGSLDEDWAFWRKGLSSFGNLYTRLILRMPIKDVTGGFRAWKRKTLEGIPLERVKSQGYAFQIEMAYITHLMGYSISEVPIYFADRSRGDSKMSLKIQVEAAKRVWSILFEYRDIQ